MLVKTSQAKVRDTAVIAIKSDCRKGFGPILSDNNGIQNPTIDMGNIRARSRKDTTIGDPVVSKVKMPIARISSHRTIAVIAPVNHSIKKFGFPKSLKGLFL